MRITFITQDFAPEVGGIQTYSQELSKRLAKKADYFSLICPSKNNADDSVFNFPVYRLNASNTFLYRKVGKALKEIVRQHGIIDATFHAQWQTIPEALKAKRKGLVKKVLVACHARELMFNPFGKGLLAKSYHKRMVKNLKQVDFFYPVSEYTKILLVNLGIPDEKIEVFINGTDSNKFYELDKSEIPESLKFNGPVLLTITRLVKRKGIDIAIKSFSKVVEEFPNAVYLIGGEGDCKKELKELTKSLGLIDNVRFIGNIPYENLNTVYNSCDVFVLPSRTIPPDVEGFGIVFLEANACGKPVIGTNSGGISSAIIDGKTGFIISEEDVDALEDKIKFLFRNPIKRKEIGRNGLERVLKEANWDAQAEKMFNHIKNNIL